LDFVATKQLDFVATKQLDFVATKQLDFTRLLNKSKNLIWRVH